MFIIDNWVPVLVSIPAAIGATVTVLKLTGRGVGHAVGKFVGKAIDSRIAGLEERIQNGVKAGLNGRYPLKQDVDQRFTGLERQFDEIPRRVITDELFARVVRHEVRAELQLIVFDRGMKLEAVLNPAPAES